MDRAFNRMKIFLYGKFLGKALPLNQVKAILYNLWRGMGSFFVANLLNGFYFIQCPSSDMVDSLLHEGPWTINGMVLQLIPWRLNFQASFEKLDTDALWIQFHHLLIEFWTIVLLESLSSQFGKVLKIDDHSLNV